MTTTVGQRLAQVRQALGLDSPRAASLAFGLAPSTWGLCEKQDRLPKTEVLLALAERNVSIDWVLTGAGTLRREGGPAYGDPAPSDPAEAARALGARYALPDYELLVSCFERVEEAHGADLEPDQRVRLACLTYFVVARDLVRAAAAGTPERLDDGQLDTWEFAAMADILRRRRS